MIYKLDHITYVIGQMEFRRSEDVRLAAIFSEHGVVNPSKEHLIQKASSIKADLYYCKGEPDKEYVVYDEIGKDSGLLYDISTNTLEGKFENYDKAIDFLSAMGLTVNEKDGEGQINSSITGIFDKRAFSLRLNKTKEILSPHLDDRGWNCPCFLVDSVKKSFDEMRKNDDIFCSVVDNVVINKRKLEVGFTKSNAINIIFELISPGK